MPARCGWPVAVRWCVRGADSCGIRGAAAARGARGRGRSCGSRCSRTVAEPPLLWFVPAVVLLRAALGLERSRIFALELLSQCGPGPRCGGIVWGVLMLSAPSPFPSRCVRMNTAPCATGPSGRTVARVALAGNTAVPGRGGSLVPVPGGRVRPLHESVAGRGGQALCRCVCAVHTGKKRGGTLLSGRAVRSAERVSPGLQSCLRARCWSRRRNTSCWTRAMH